jgi:hypothetical protein
MGIMVKSCKEYLPTWNTFIPCPKDLITLMVVISPIIQVVRSMWAQENLLLIRETREV